LFRKRSPDAIVKIERGFEPLHAMSRPAVGCTYQFGGSPAVPADSAEPAIDSAGSGTIAAWFRPHGLSVATNPVIRPARPDFDRISGWIVPGKSAKRMTIGQRSRRSSAG
jgi:hypothetical protein